MRSIKQAAVIFVLVFAFSSLTPSSTLAAGTSDFKTLETFSLYGAGAGTLAGLVTVPFTKDIRTMFIGTSVGLFLGIIAGFYHINNRGNPENPFNNNFNPYPKEDPNYPRDEGMQSPDKSPPPILMMAHYSVLRF